MNEFHLPRELYAQSLPPGGDGVPFGVELH